MPRLYAAIVLLAVAAPVAAQPTITTPKAHFGFDLGADYHLANYEQYAEYLAKLAKESDRIKVVDIGTTAEKRSQLMAIVTSPANHKKLDALQAAARKLGRVETLNTDEAKKLAAEGKAVVWIDAGLHATETLCAQAQAETIYRIVSGTDAETLRILDDVVILFVHANPDGHDLVADWYMRDRDPKKRTLSGLPKLYQKYIGHDNNRDFYAHTQAETRNMNKVMYREWLPQVVYNHHQTGPPGTVLFCPPFRDPFNYNFDPLVVSGIDALGAAMMQRFLVEGKPGATSRSGARYSTWWNGGLRTTCYFHNMIGLLTETIGSPTPMRVPFNTALQLPRADYLAPVPPQEWHFRQSVEYSVTANKAVLDYASRHREQLLFNIWLMGKNAIDRGNTDSWTVTPKVAEAAKGVRGGAEQFTKFFRDPAKRDARGYILEPNQPDFLTATKFVNALIGTGVTVHRATAGFEVGKKSYMAGSYVVKSAQPFRAHVLDMFEPQDHPNDFAYPGAPPTAPYDVAGYTLALQMGVKFDRVLDKFDGPFEELKGEVPPPPGKVIDGHGNAAYALSPWQNDAFRAVNVLLAAGEDVRRVVKPWPFVVRDAAPGYFVVTAKKGTKERLEKVAGTLGVSFWGLKDMPNDLVALKPVRIALWDRYGGSMPSGWTRWLLEQFEFPFRVVFPPELDKGGLREKFDVLLLVDGALAGPGGGKKGPGDGGDAAPGDDPNVVDELGLPAEFRGRRGSITPARTVPHIKKFLEEGGTVIAIGTSTSLAKTLGLPVENHLVAKNADGKDAPLSREKFYVPTSVLRAAVDPEHPLAWGIEREVDVTFGGSPTFKLGAGVKPVAWFAGKTPLRSGWAWGQEYLDGGVAIADAPVGKGHLVLCGPQVLFRAQPHGTFKFVFNAIVRAAEK